MTLIRAILPTVHRRLVTINGDAPLVDAAKLLSEMHTSLVVVCDPAGLIFGVITKADVVKQISHCQGCSCTTMVSDTMTREVVSCNVDDRVLDAWHTMKDKGLRPHLSHKFCWTPWAFNSMMRSCLFPVTNFLKRPLPVSVRAY
jgi:CBS domain-containing protein